MDTFSLIVVSDETSPVRRFELRKDLLKRGAVLGVLAVVLLLGLMVDYVRMRNTAKRGGDKRRISLEQVVAGLAERNIDLLGLDEALDRLEAVGPRKCRVVELRFFADLSIAETAEVLGISDATVERDWKMAKVWLHRELAVDDLLE